MKTLDIELAIAKYFGIRRHIIIPNISWGFHYGHEMDLIVITRSNYAKEIEIKISKNDFYADFKKKHNHESIYIREFYYAMPNNLYEQVKNDIPLHAGVLTVDKHVRLMKKPVINNKSIKLTTEDLLKLSRLGCMRIWSLKNKIQKNELKK